MNINDWKQITNKDLEMAEEKQTTIQIDKETDRQLARLAAAYERSKAAQIRYWVKRDVAELERLKLLPQVPAETDPKTQL
jgi:hypothetical protein